MFLIFSFFAICVASQLVEEEIVIKEAANLELAFPIQALNLDDYANFIINYRPTGTTMFKSLYRAKFKNNQSIIDKR